MNATRIRGVFKRQFYWERHSPPILFDMFVWPVLDLFLWGLLTTFLQREPGAIPAPFGFLLGGVLLWDLMFRSSLGVSMAFLEDAAWSRNLINMLVAPVRPGEFLIGALGWTLAKVAVGWGLMALVAWLAFSFGVLEVGLGLVAFATALVLFGVAMAMLVLALLFRFGQGVEVLAWAFAAMLSPLAAVYYPVSVLPGWARSVAAALPPSHIFESMRAVLAGRAFSWSELLVALGLDVLYLAGAFALARAMFESFRRRGSVTRYM
jgi:ABC-2 type transport system permease protein